MPFVGFLFIQESSAKKKKRKVKNKSIIRRAHPFHFVTRNGLRFSCYKCFQYQTRNVPSLFSYKSRFASLQNAMNSFSPDKLILIRYRYSINCAYVWCKMKLCACWIKTIRFFYIRIFASLLLFGANGFILQRGSLLLDVYYVGIRCRKEAEQAGDIFSLHFTLQVPLKCFVLNGLWNEQNINMYGDAKDFFKCRVDFRWEIHKLILSLFW